MGLFSTPASYRRNVAVAGNDFSQPLSANTFTTFALFAQKGNTHPSHPTLGRLILLVFEAVMEVVCVSLPGYILARLGMFDSDNQKFVANLNVALFTPSLIFTKLASQSSADKFLELAVIPVIFVVQTAVSFLVSITVSKGFGFKKRHANFVTAMGVFGNSNSLPISLVISLSQTLKGLHWDKVPGDNDDEVAARGILYLLIFQQLGQLLRWSWGYHVLLAPRESYREESDVSDNEEGRYSDEPEFIPGLDGCDEGEFLNGTQSTTSFESGGRTTATNAQYASFYEEVVDPSKKRMLATPTNGNVLSINGNGNGIISFPSIRTSTSDDERDLPIGSKDVIPRPKFCIQRGVQFLSHKVETISQKAFHGLPMPLQSVLANAYHTFSCFMVGVWEFMNPPLLAMLLAVIIASIPKFQRLFFEEGSFIANSVTRAISQSGGVAVPLILVVLGANLARNNLSEESFDPESEESQVGTKLMIASLISRMLLPAIIMAPMLALAAKFVPVSILDDPIFVIVCFLLTGAPSALQLAQICQMNGVYEGVVTKLLFQSYVIWILPSTLILVVCALEVVEWAKV